MGPIILLALIPMTTLLSLASCTPYQSPGPIDGKALISGQVIIQDEPTAVAVALSVVGVDGDDLARFRYEIDESSPLALTTELERAENQYLIDPGIRLITFNRTRTLLGRRVADRDELEIKAEIRSNQVYRISAEILVGNTISYWVEEVESGKKASGTFYDPAHLSDELKLVDMAREQNIDTVGVLSIQPENLFATKRFLVPPSDCFHLVGELQIDVAESILWSVLTLGGGQNTNYGYRSYQEICIQVEGGHTYEVQYHRGERGENSHGPFIDREIWYEIWDVTDERMLLKLDKWGMKDQQKGFE